MTDATVGYTEESLLGTLSDHRGCLSPRYVQLFNQGKRLELLAALEAATSYLDRDADVKRRFYHLKYGPVIPKCVCGANAKFVRKEYNQYCSTKCANESEGRVAQIKKTKQERYGDDYVEVLLEKSKATNMERYGVEFPLLNAEVLAKTGVTQVELYGEKGFNEHSRRVAASSLISKYGVASGNAGLDEELDRQIRENVDRLHYEEKWTITAIAKHYGVSNTSVLNRLTGDVVRHPTSALELKVQEFIRTVAPNLELALNVRNVIAPKEIDIWIPSLQVGIELHGNWYHSHRNGVHPRMHQEKMLMAEAKGIRLIQLFQSEVDYSDQWKGVVTAAIGATEVVYARKCQVVELDHLTVSGFMNEHHFQKAGTNPLCAYGLMYNGQLMQVMSFGKPRFNKDHEWEILRLATRVGYNVVGGASRLFTQFVSTHSPKSVISYCDRRLFTGGVYRALGFTHLYDTDPAYWYFHQKDPQQVLHNRVHFQKHKLADKLETFDPTLSEWQNMVANGWNKVYDCGNGVWSWLPKS